MLKAGTRKAEIMHTFHTTIDVRHAKVDYWCPHDDGRHTLTLNGNHAAESIYLRGELSEIARFARQILAVVDRQAELARFAQAASK